MRTYFEIRVADKTDVLVEKLNRLSSVHTEISENKMSIVCERTDAAESVEILLGLEGVQYVAVREGGLFFAPSVYSNETKETVYFTVEDNQVVLLNLEEKNVDRVQALRYINQYVQGNDDTLETRTFFRFTIDSNRWREILAEEKCQFEEVSSEDMDEIIVTDRSVIELIRNKLNNNNIDFLEVQYGNRMQSPRIVRNEEKEDYWTIIEEGGLRVLDLEEKSKYIEKEKFYLNEKLANMFM